MLPLQFKIVRHQGNRIGNISSGCLPFVRNFSKISHSLFQKKGNRIRHIHKNRRIIQAGRPFEPSSTVVHPRTTVEGEFCVCTKHRCTDRKSVATNSIEFFHQKNLKLKNVHGCTFFSDAILGSSSRMVSIILRGCKKSLVRLP